MLKVLLVASVGVLGVTGAARAETWRLGLELIHDWSLFTCPHSMPDRFWYFTLQGSQLKALGPEGAAFSTTVAENGSFKASFTGSFTKTGTDRTDYPSNEVTGNLKVPWIHLHSVASDCWYKLVPR